MCWSDIGVVRLRIYPLVLGNPEITLYNSPDSVSQKEKIIFFFSNHGGVQLVPSFDSISLVHKIFNPLFFNNVGGWVSVYLRCLQQKNKWYEVIFDESIGATAWIMLSDDSKLYTWNRLLKHNVIAIRVINSNTVILKENPNVSSENIEFNIRNCFTAKRVKNDWLFMKSYTEFCYENNEYNGNIKAWVQFKEKEKMLVEIIDVFELE